MAELLPFEIILGDCIDVMAKLPEQAYDVVIADPPYMIGATSIAEPRLKSGTWADTMNAASWYRDWFEAASRVLRRDGYILVFGNWRSLPSLNRAIMSREALAS